MNEAEIQANVALYLRRAYPKILFHSDFGSGTYLKPWQAKAQKIQNGGRRAWPDMFIAEPQEIPRPGLRPVARYNGLFIEFKKEGTKLKRKRDGEWVSEHIKEQAWMLEQLRSKGYKAEFAVGYQAAINLIEDYLKGKR